MSASLPIAPPMAKVNSDGTATCPGDDRMCVGSSLATIRSGAAQPDGGVHAPIAPILGGGDGATQGGADSYEQRLANAAADLRRTWARHERLVLQAFERRYRTKIAELKPWWDYHMGITTKPNFTDAQLHVMWELRQPGKFPYGPARVDTSHMGHAVAAAGRTASASTSAPRATSRRVVRAQGSRRRKRGLLAFLGRLFGRA